MRSRSSKIDTPLASNSISGTPPPILPFTSYSPGGPSGVSLISVWNPPVLTPQAPESCCGDLEHRGHLFIGEVGGNEKPCFPKRRRRWESPVYPPLAELAGGNQTTPPTGSQRNAQPGPTGAAHEILLDHHSSLSSGLWREQGDLADEVASVLDITNRVLTTTGCPRLENRRVCTR